MAGRPTKFSAEVLNALVEQTRRGAYAWVAAEAAGIGRRTFHRWMALGERGEEPFVLLAVEVRRAQAQARLGAEQAVWRRNPLSWLRLGPGRERLDEPGWTQPVGPVTQAEDGELLEESREGLEEIARAMEEAGWGEDSSDEG